MINPVFLLLCLFLLVGPVYAQDDFSVAETVYWDNRPIPVLLQVGIERQVSFPAGVRLGIPSAIHDRLRTQSVDGTVHWLAYEPFETTRVQVREIQSGRTYLLDLSAVAEGGEITPLEVIDMERLAEEQSPGTMTAMESMATPPETFNSTGSEAIPPAAITNFATETDPAMVVEHTLSAPPSYDYVTLTRFAVQQLYAPERLLSRLQLPAVTRVPVRRQAMPLYRGGALRTEPYVAWTDGELYVTAVKLSNTTARRVIVDPRNLRGRWLARTVLYAELQPSSDSLGRDQSFVFLLSPLPFDEASR